MGVKLPIAQGGLAVHRRARARSRSGSALLGRRRLALPFAAAALASAGFFRDPERAIPSVPRRCCRRRRPVLSIEDAVDPFVGPSVRVAIFLSPLDVHVNRAPDRGRGRPTVYTPGASARPTTRAPRPTSAARSACRASTRASRRADRRRGRAAHRLPRGRRRQAPAGERYGMIRFGSRTDCYMPRGTEVTRAGRRAVRGGQHGDRSAAVITASGQAARGGGPGRSVRRAAAAGIFLLPEPAHHRQPLLRLLRDAADRSIIATPRPRWPSSWR
jgi:hypothetical protein